MEGYPLLPLLFQQLLGAVRRGYYISSGNSAKNERKSTICGLFGGDGDGVAGDGTGKLNCFIVNMLRYFSWKAVSLKGTVFPLLTSSVMGSVFFQYFFFFLPCSSSFDLLCFFEFSLRIFHIEKVSQDSDTDGVCASERPSSRSGLLKENLSFITYLGCSLTLS